MFARNARYLLGCGSLPKMSNDDAEATFDLLASRGVLKENLQAHVLESHRFSGDPSLGKAQIPALAEPGHIPFLRPLDRRLLSG